VCDGYVFDLESIGVIYGQVNTKGCSFVEDVSHFWLEL
jgi:hypothetical protein